MTDDKILRPKFGDAPMTIDRRHGVGCMHHFIALRQHFRTVVCRQCGEQIDAFEVLFNVARSWETCTYNTQKIEDQQALIKDLEREEQNLKARIRTARNKIPEPKTEAFFAEWLSKLEHANSHRDIWNADNWAANYRWLTAENLTRIADARRHAERRAEDNDRAASRRRKVGVIKGGK